MEVIAGGGGLLSVLLAGHQRDYITWLLAACAEDRARVSDLIDADAVDLPAERLRTPL